MEPTTAEFPAQGMDDFRKRHFGPIVTGTSVLALQFDGGVVIAADTLASYGRMAKWKNITRIFKVNDQCVITASGDLADFEFLTNHIKQMINDDECAGDSVPLSPKAVFSFLTRVMYNRRSNFNPLWNTYVVGGLEEGVPFTGYISSLGMAYTEPVITTGFGNHMAKPVMRELLESNARNKTPVTEAKALEVIDTCETLLFYRDCLAYDKYDVAVITKDGCTISTRQALKKPKWEVANHVQGFC